MSKTCRTEVMLMNNPFSAKYRPGQILSTWDGATVRLAEGMEFKPQAPYLLPKPKTNLAGSGEVLKSRFPSRIKRSGRKTSGSS